ncbi:MAG: glycogen/starch/alpha-glucan phosphorylase [Anaerolineales bacterium]|nr:glycogen/starch/alpha-glucan phosphorylase [Anaerolineales bacterium]
MDRIGQASWSTVVFTMSMPYTSAKICLHSAMGSTVISSSAVRRGFSSFWPAKFTNVTNGVTPRRFLRMANPWLSSLIAKGY